MRKIINLTRIPATPEQIADGVFDIEDGDVRAMVWRLLTFTDLPVPGEVAFRAARLVSVVARQRATAAMIDGAPYLMGTLERMLKEAGITPLHSFVQDDGSEHPTAIKHIGWVEV